MLFEDYRFDCRPSQQKAKHYARGPSAYNAATGFNGFGIWNVLLHRRWLLHELQSN
jgi:hypothetical protein